MVFPDTSPRGIEGYENWDLVKKACQDGQSALLGYGAGHYCNATDAPFNKNFNMYSYISEELPALVEKYFHVSAERKSIMGHSMGGHGALLMAIKNPKMFKSVSAFAPLANPASATNLYVQQCLTAYFGSAEGYKTYDVYENLKAKGKDLKLPHGLIDYGTADAFTGTLMPEKLLEGLRANGHNNVEIRH
jgi:S-formylglutathione hydrolase